MVLTFENEFKICSYALRLFGVHPSFPYNKKWFAQIIFINSISYASFFFLVNSATNYDIRNGKYTEAIKNVSIAIISLTISFKYYILIRYKSSLANLIKIINEDYSLSNEQYSRDEKLILLDYCKKGSKVCKFWLLAAIPTGGMFPIKALFLMSYSFYEGKFELIPMFDLTYPKIINVHKEALCAFLLLFMFCLVFDFYATSMYVGFDPLVPIFLLHVCGQIDILCQRIKNVMIGAKDVIIIRRKLKHICQKQQALYRFLLSVQSNFITLFEINMKTTTFILPFAAFQIVQSLHRLELNIEFTFFFIAGFTHFFIPCYYSNLLMDKGECLREAIYTCSWETEPDIGIRKTILLMLTRCSVPMSMRTIFYDVNLETFAQMCRQSYAIFNALNTIRS